MHISVHSLGREAQVHPVSLRRFCSFSPPVGLIGQDWGWNTPVYIRPTGGCAHQGTEQQVEGVCRQACFEALGNSGRL